MSSRSWAWRQACRLPITDPNSRGTCGMTQSSPGSLQRPLHFSSSTTRWSTRSRKSSITAKFEDEGSISSNGRGPLRRLGSGKLIFLDVWTYSRITSKGLASKDAFSRLSSPVQCPKALREEIPFPRRDEDPLPLRSLLLGTRCPLLRGQPGVRFVCLDEEHLRCLQDEGGSDNSSDEVCVCVCVCMCVCVCACPLPASMRACAMHARWRRRECVSCSVHDGREEGETKGEGRQGLGMRGSGVLTSSQHTN